MEQCNEANADVWLIDNFMLVNINAEAISSMQLVL